MFLKAYLCKFSSVDGADIYQIKMGFCSIQITFSADILGGVFVVTRFA